MANKQNLVSFTSDQSHDEAVKNGAKGGRASGKARREKKLIKEYLDYLLDKEVSKDKDGKAITGAEGIAIAQMKKALKGDTRAFEVIRDTVGQKPVERVMVADVDQSIIDEVEGLVNAERNNDADTESDG